MWQPWNCLLLEVMAIICQKVASRTSYGSARGVRPRGNFCSVRFAIQIVFVKRLEFFDFARLQKRLKAVAAVGRLLVLVLAARIEPVIVV